MPDSHPYQRRQRLHDKRQRLYVRSQIISRMRDFFHLAGFLEVETPQRIPAPAPEQYVDPEPSGSWFMAASPELQMKQLLCAGYDKIFWLGHCFRKGERGPHHLPEFTMLEWYRSQAGLEDLMRDCEQLLCRAAADIALPEPLTLPTPFAQTTVDAAFRQYAGWSPGPSPDQHRFDMDLVTKVEPALPTNAPLFLTHYPRSMASLAQISPDNPDTALRFELYWGGLELANAYAELTDPQEQRQRFQEASHQRLQDGKPAMPLDEHFLRQLDLGMPTAAGIALGVDRLVMCLTGATSIDEVVAFPDP